MILDIVELKTRLHLAHCINKPLFCCRSEMACYPGQPANMECADDPSYTADHGDGFGNSTSLKPHSTQSIVAWLEDTYHYEDGICLPRSTIYEHYVDFCQCELLQPVNAASFGKIIRQQFPSLTTRRLGTRGQSKYHYYGLGIKETSKYYTEDYLQKQQNQGIIRKEPETKKTHAYYATKEKPSVMLPKFPDVKNLKHLGSIPMEKLHTFMVMYRAHCQRILDSVVRANFDEVESFLLHFWQGMPPHLISVLSTELVVDLVAVCDMTLYNAIINVFITTPLQNIPDNVAHEVRSFTGKLKEWLELALKNLPECLSAIKFKVADNFCKNFKRQRSLMHLAEAARNAFKGEESLEMLENDWSGLNLQTVFAQTLYTIQPLGVPQCYLDMVPTFLEDFSCMFTYEKCSIEDFALWIDSIMDNCLKDIGNGSRTAAGKVFLLTWKFFTSKIVRDFTLMSAPSFGTFHLLHMLVDDYIMHTIESMREKEEEAKHLNRINRLRQDGEEDGSQGCLKDRLPSSDNHVAVSHLHAEVIPSSSALDFSKYVSDQSSNPPAMGVAVGRQRGEGSGAEIGVVTGRGLMIADAARGSAISGLTSEGLKNKDFMTSPHTTESISQASLQDSSLLMMSSSGDGGLPIQLSGHLPHRSGLVSRGNKPPPNSHYHHHERDGFGVDDLMSSQDNNLQPDHALALQLAASSGSADPSMSSETVPSQSLNYPKLSNSVSSGDPSTRTLIQPEEVQVPKGAQTHSQPPTHSQTNPPLPFSANLGSFTFSSMMGHFAPQLQSQALPTTINPSSGGGADGRIMQSLGAPLRSNNRSSNTNNMIGISTQSRLPISSNPSLSSSSVSSVLGGLNPSLSIVNPPVSFNVGGGGGRVANLSPSSNISMPLAHPIAASNHTSLPLLSGMPAVYSYPYTATLPTQSISSSMVRMNAPGPTGFPPGGQTLVPGGYHQYVPQSLYGHSQQPPVSTCNFTI